MNSRIYWLIVFIVLLNCNIHAQIQLGATYPNETWRPASLDEFSWLVGEWFQPTIPGFVSRYKIENGKLYRQNEGVHFEHFVSEWVETKVFVSNNDIIRLWHNKDGWAGSFILRKANNTCEYYVNERYVKDNGEVGSKEKRLVLNVDKCKIHSNGWTYECDCDKK